LKNKVEKIASHRILKVGEVDCEEIILEKNKVRLEVPYAIFCAKRMVYLYNVLVKY
jgi:hypothetical protein